MEGTAAAGGTGSAPDATVRAVSNVGQLEEALKAARAAEEALLPQRHIDAAQRSVDKAEAQLVAAHAALDQAYIDNEVRAAEAEAGRLAKAARRAAAAAEGI